MVSDDGVAQNTKFCTHLHENKLNISQESELLNGKKSVPCVFVRDEVFQLQ
jgi:hypothetical protein